MTQVQPIENTTQSGKWKTYPAYKDSSVEWLGDIPKHWEVKRLKYTAPISTSKLTEKPADLPYLGLENIESKTGRLLLDTPIENVESAIGVFEQGNVLFGKLRPYLAKVAYVNFQGVSTTELLVLQPNGELNGKFLFYRLLSQDFIQIVNSMTYGTKMPRASGEQISNLAIQLPSLPEQRAIAAFLDRETARINDLIAKKERMIELLREKRTALISHVVTKGLNPTVKMKDSGVEWIGEIPEHWEVKRLKYLSLKGLVNGLFKKKDQFGSGCKLINVVNLYNDNFQIDFNSLDRVITQQDEYETYKVLPGDIFFVRSSLKLEGVGASAFIVKVPEPVVFECHLVRIRPSKESIPNYLISYLNSAFTRQRLVALAETTTMTTISQPKLASLEIVVSPLPEQQAIATYLDQETAKIDALITRIGEGIEKLKEYSTALISAAVTGKIDVRGEIISQEA